MSALTNEELINQAVCRTFERMQHLIQANRGGLTTIAVPEISELPRVTVPNLRMEEVEVPAQCSVVDKGVSKKGPNNFGGARTKEW